MNKNQYVPALNYSWLTRFYDPIVALGTRERVFREKLLKQTEIKPGDRVFDEGMSFSSPYADGEFVALEVPGHVKTWLGTLDFLSAKKPGI